MLDEGIRPFKWELETEGDLLRNYAETMYLKKTPPNIFQPAWEERFAFMKELIRVTGRRALVSLCFMKSMI